MGAKGDNVDGVILLDKPKGMSSNWALQLTRRHVNAKKAGHTGTLDPMASGLLPLAFGNATKYSADLLHADKRYLAEVTFGTATETMDAEGEVTERSDVVVTREALEAVLPEFTGEIEQTPPMYSAIKHGGKNLYDLARKGIEVERKPRKVTVKALKLVTFEGQTAVLDVWVTKGTYIRVLADDIGRRLGTFAHLTALRRTAVGDLRIEDAVPFTVIDDDKKTTEEKRAAVAAVGDVDHGRSPSASKRSASCFEIRPSRRSPCLRAGKEFVGRGGGGRARRHSPRPTDKKLG